MLAIIFGIIGESTKLGFWSIFLMSIFLTPAIALMVVLTASPKKKKCRTNSV